MGKGVMDQLDQIGKSGGVGALLAGNGADLLGGSGNIKISDITRREPFVSAFDLSGEEFDQIKANMSESGYDDHFPVFLWKNGDDLVLFDGHRRIAAAEENNLSVIPALIFENFSSDDEVLSRIRFIQYARRNVPENQKFKDMLEMVTSGDAGKLPNIGANAEENRLREKLGRYFGISSASAARWIKVIKKGEKHHPAILSGTKSVNSSYSAIKDEEDRAKAQEKKETEGGRGPIVDRVPDKQEHEKDADSTEDHGLKNDASTETPDPENLGSDPVTHINSFRAGLLEKPFLQLLDHLKELGDKDAAHSVNTHAHSLSQAGVLNDVELSIIVDRVVNK